MPIAAAPLRFVFIDLTTATTPDALRPGAILPSLIAALLAQVSDDWGPFYGNPGVAMRVGTVADRAADEIAVNFRDTIPQDGALAYHTVTDGVPDVEIACDLFETISSGNESMTQGASHEILELLGDRGANGWKDKQDAIGTTEAEEVADPVQNTFYMQGDIAVSNFVLPSYFIPGAPGPWDFLGVMTAQTDIVNGYAIRATAPVDVQDVQGEVVRAVKRKHHLVGEDRLTEKQRARKSSVYSRTYRRGVRL
jgi:hypothetical protein